MSESRARDARSECAAFAAEVGPCTRRALEDEDRLAEAARRVSSECDARDAVFSVTHALFREDGELCLWSEMIAYAYERIRGRGSRMARGRLANVVETGDLLNSVFVSVWVRPDAFEFRSFAQFVSFLSKRLGWKCRTIERVWWRTSDHFAQGDPSEHPQPDGLPSAEESPDGALETSELLEQLEHALAVETPEGRRVFEMWFKEQMSFSAIARELGVHRSFVKRIIERVRDRLRPPEDS